MRNYVQKADVIDLTAPYDRASGQGMLVGSIFAVAMVALASGVAGAAVIKGRCTLTKHSAEAWTQGEVLYWDDTNKYVTATSSGNTKIGFAAAVAANPSSTGDVVLNGTV